MSINIDIKIVENALKKLKWNPENGAIIVYLGVVKGLKGSKEIDHIEVMHNIENIRRELHDKIRDDENVVIELHEGKAKPGDLITLVIVQGQDRYDACMKLLKILDTVKKNTKIVEHYVN